MRRKDLIDEIFGGNGSTSGKGQKMSKEELSGVLLTESTLDQYITAMRHVEGGSAQDEAIQEFFGSDAYENISDNGFHPYSHHKLQWVQSQYFDKLGMKLIKACDYGFIGEQPPQMIDIEYEPDKVFKGYKQGAVFYASEEGKKVVIVIRESYNSSGFTYQLYHNTNNETLLKDWIDLADENNFYKGKKIDASCRFLELTNYSWEDVVLPEKTLEVIKNNVLGLFKHAETFRKFGISMKRGLILHGPPGTGKTQICKAIANEAEAAVLYVLPSDLQNERGGVRRVTQMAKDLAPCILIIEDMDWIAKYRHASMVAGFTMELMNQLDGLEEFGEIVTIGTTNALEDLENAVKNRPGRFDRVIEVPHPEEEQREAMIRLFTNRFTLRDVNVGKIAESFDGLSGAHVRDICQTAAHFAVRDGSIESDGEELVITEKHFKRAWKEVKDKDYSSYQETQSTEGRKPNFGFQARRSADYLDDDDDLL